MAVAEVEELADLVVDGVGGLLLPLGLYRGCHTRG